MLNRNSILASRLASIILRLFQGETLYLAKLAEEYGVHQRTIRRDIEERLSFLGISHDPKNYGYSLVTRINKKSDIDSIELFSRLVGVNGLFPRLNQETINSLLKGEHENGVIVHGHKYITEKINSDDFERIKKSILEHRKISFFYSGRGKEKSYSVEPYKLVNYNGIWYLAAIHNNKIKNFSLIKITNLNCTFDTFIPSKEILDKVDQEESVWGSTQKVEVTLSVSSHVAEYFLRRELLNEQEIKHHTVDGDLIISTKISHPTELLPTVQYWIPHIKIIEPYYLKEELVTTIRDWLKE
ncbi:WYL domain-containing protein [Providencia stuartii]|uniref:helix-turn-helix transcriptional regulator n=1 Tax=Providencia TaxID=586 RepID=UPI0024B19B8A|nr:WYL domain-containing protein [Providencia sp. 2023EL-00965]ELR5299394.1 WYL domain-containing protein [Providencia stuartii]MDW7588468.1 WYL domain-containing protein [Providencia sp. 2023EL-00965]